MKIKKLTNWAFNGLLILFLFIPVSAAANCGNIIVEYDAGEEEGIVEDVTPIENCDNPFNADFPEPFAYELKINDQFVTANSLILIPEGESVSYSFIIDKVGNFSKSIQFFRREGEDYRMVFLTEFNDLAAGDYVATLTFEEAPMLMYSKPTWIQFIKNLFTPARAFAFYSDFTEVVAIPFTLEYAPTTPEPTGASSVLFLPGIMGSRLYESGTFCDSLNIEKQLWFSINDCLQLRLATNFIGQSLNQIYTKDGEEGILDEAFVFNIYKTFLGDLSEWKQDGLINNYEVVPYDWRVSLDNILKSDLKDGTNKIYSNQTQTITEGNLYQKINALAESSNTGKVTVVAHSNGGLVIKQLLSALQNTNDPLLDKIDNLILVAVPQLGTPEALVGILHGTELDFVMPQAVTRKLMNTMSFAHHLLPTDDYFATVDTPAIKFEAGEATNDWIATFGSEITNQNDLHEFLSQDSGRTEPDYDDLETPSALDNLLLNYAETTAVIQSNFTPAENMKVYQIAGIGLETPSTLVYFSDKECVSRSLFTCNEYQPKISYRVEMTLDGDETVLLPSSLALATGSQVEKRWLNLFEYNDDNFNRRHKDILEISEVLDFIKNTIQATSSNYEYLTEGTPEIDDGERLIYQLHSPLDMYLVTDNGKIVSSSTNEVDSAVYRRYGELQYISIPRSEEAKLILNGLAMGSFTLDIEEVDNGEIVKRHTYSAIPSDVGTKVELEINENTVINELILTLDYNGDGETDVSYDTEGVIAEKVTYDDLFASIENLNLHKVTKKILLKTAESAENFYNKSLSKSKYKKLEKNTLQILLKQLKLYERLRVISKEQRLELEEIITSLLNN